MGNPGLTLTLTGSGFSGARHNFSQAVWSINGSNTLLATTFVNSTQLTAVIPAALLSSPATAQIFVQTGDPMGDVPLSRTNTVSFSVTTTVPGPTSPGIPTISSISPTSAAAGSPDLTLTVTGSNFVRNLYYFSQAVWSVNGVKTSLPTISSSSNQLTVLIPAALLSNAVSAQVFVQTADQDGIPASSPTQLSSVSTSLIR